MRKLLRRFFGLQPNTEYIQAKQCKQPCESINLLIITDIHSALTREQLLIISKNRENANLILTLGDIDLADLSFINPDYGVLGNHDRWRTLHCTQHLHGRIIECSGIRIAGFSGGSLYKDNLMWAQWTQEDSIQEAMKIPACDILIAHDGVFIGGDDDAHCGLQGITEYLNKNEPRLLIHGHCHENKKRFIGRTEVISVYKCAVISINEVFDISVNLLF